MNKKSLLSVGEACTLLGISKPTFARWERDEGLPTARIGRRVLVPADKLMEWVESKIGKEGILNGENLQQP